MGDDCTILEDPFLVFAPNAFANNNLGSIDVLCGGETHGAREGGLNEKLPVETKDMLSEWVVYNGRHALAYGGTWAVAVTANMATTAKKDFMAKGIARTKECSLKESVCGAQET